MKSELTFEPILWTIGSVCVNASRRKLIRSGGPAINGTSYPSTGRMGNTPQNGKARSEKADFVGAVRSLSIQERGEILRGGGGIHAGQDRTLTPELSLNF